MSLDLTPVHRNLHTKVTFLGLEFEDLILVLALGSADESPCPLRERQRACVRDAAQHLHGVRRAGAGRAVPDPFQVRQAARLSHRPRPLVLCSEGLVRA